MDAFQRAPLQAVGGEALLDALGLRDAYDHGRRLRSSIAHTEAAATTLLMAFQSEVRHGLWTNERKLHAFQQGQQQHALRSKAVDVFIAAHDNQVDLPLVCWPVLQSTPAVPNGQDVLDLITFFDKALQPHTDRVGPAFWTRSLLQEAQLHVYDIAAAELRRQLRATWQPCIDTLDAHLQDGSYASSSSYLVLLDLLFELGDLDVFEETYDTFRRLSGSETTVFPWLGNVVATDVVQASDSPRFTQLLRQIITVKRLRHRPDDHALVYLQHLYADIQVRMNTVVASAQSGVMSVEQKDLDLFSGSLSLAEPVLPTPDTIGFPLPHVRTLKHCKRIIKQVLAQLDGDHAWNRRRAATLGFWYAFLCYHTGKLTECQQALAKLPEGTESLAVLCASLRGEAAFLTGAYEHAYLHYERSQTIAEQLLSRFQRLALTNEQEVRAARAFVGQLCQWRGNIFMNLGDFALADEAYQQVEAYMPEAAPVATVMQCVNRGNLAFLQNNLVDSRGYITYDAAALAKLRDDDPTPFLRLKFERNRDALATAQNYYETGMALLPSIRSESERQRWEATLSANLGNICMARAHLLAESQRLPADVRADLSKIGTRVELYQQALDLYEAAYERVVDMIHPNRPLAAVCLINISEISLLLGEYKATNSAKRTAASTYAVAEQAAFDAMWLLNSDIRDAVLHGDDEQLAGKDTFYPEHSWRIYLILARMYQHTQKPSRALRAYNRALHTVERMRQFIHTASWQTATVQNKLQVYEAAIAFLYQSDRVDHAARIFELTEHLKAHAFRDLLQSTQLDLDDYLPESLRTRRARLAELSTRLNQQLRRADINCDTTSLLNKQAWLDNARAKLESQIHQAQMKEHGAISPPTLNWEACRVLFAHHPDTVMLSFTLGTDQSFLLIGDADGLDVFTLPGRTEIEVAVTRLLWYATFKKVDGTIEYAAINRHVVDLLLKPVLDAGMLERLQGRHIIIVPDGILCYLPFEMLLVRQPVDAHGQPLDFEAYRTRTPDSGTNGLALSRDLLPFYMLELGAITYAPSLSVWQMVQSTAPDPSTPEHTALGVYRVLYTANAKQDTTWMRAQELGIAFSNLDQTGRINQILDDLEDDPQRILRLSGGDDGTKPWPPHLQATKENFVQLLEQHRVRYVVFAGHGIYNDKYPQFSGIVFNMIDSAGATQETSVPPAMQDGFFGVQDVFKLRMPATELVFLAACQGGIGQLSRGEGVNALARAFMYRGSPTVIASLWQVDVLATMELVAAFFALVRAQPDADKGQLLQQAKQTVIANGPDTYAHPYFWAPFIVIGRR